MREPEPAWPAVVPADETLQESRPVMQRVVDAEKAFER
jgi:hypothetical protein